MSDKALYYLGVSVGSVIGGYVPVLFGASSFSLWTVLTGGIGGALGLWLMYRWVHG